MLYNTENKRNFHHTKITRYTVSILKSIAIYKTNDTNYSVLNCYCNWHAIGHAHASYASHSHNYIAGYFRGTSCIHFHRLLMHATKHFVDFIFEDRGSNDHTLRSLDTGSKQ